MNERILEAAFQSLFITKRVSDGSYFIDDPELMGKLEKFAELIVRMCADAADMYEGKSDYVGDCVAEYMGYGQEEGIAEWRASRRSRA
jgi:hypothetical protein